MDKKPHGYNICSTMVYSKDGHQVKQRDLAALHCPLCELVLRDPVQVITCGHRFCRGCLELKTSTSIGPLKCPIDGEVFEPNQIRNDKGCFKEIQGLLVDCPTKPLPCSWRGPLMEIEEHSDECPKRELACGFGCGAKFPRSDTESHSAECPKRPINCDYCGTSVPCDLIEDHYKCCEEYPVSCDFCKENLSSRKQFEQHLEDECTEYVMNCPVDKCTFKGKRPQMALHIQGKHTIQYIEKITKLEWEVAESKNEIQQLRIQKGNFEGRLREVTENVQSLQETMTRHSIAIDEIRLRQDVLDVKMTNGTFIWKIPEVRRRYRDAVEQRKIGHYSPPFYTSPHGYRMCIRVYLNGDGVGRGTHVSVFFVLMRSEHDSLLSWPFRQSVRFTLINQVNPNASISEAFMPDLESPSFQKPDGDMNIASGFPKFAKQAVLNDINFTLGNAIFIKAQVDRMGLNYQ